MTSVGPDLSEFLAFQKGHGPACGVGRALIALSQAEVESLKAALATDDIQHQAIEAWCRKHGQSVGKGSVSRHRNGICRCER